jgi:hypothetical protein
MAVTPKSPLYFDLTTIINEPLKVCMEIDRKKYLVRNIICTSMSTNMATVRNIDIGNYA